MGIILNGSEVFNISVCENRETNVIETSLTLSYRGYNTWSNLLLITYKEHNRLHANYTEVEVICPICKNTFKVSTRRQGYRPRIHCSKQCTDIASRKVNRPSKEQLELDVKSMSMVAIGKKYGVSDNAVRKWIKNPRVARLVKASLL